MANKKLFEGTHNATPQPNRRIPIGYENIEGSEYVEVQEITAQINEALTTDLMLRAWANPGWDSTTQPTANDIVINEVSGTLTFGTINGAAISVNNPAYYYIEVNGRAERFDITEPVVFDWSAKTEGIWWFWFNASGAQVQQTAVPPTFGTAAMLYRLYYSAVDGLGNTRSIEYHPNSQSADEHEWKHQAFGTVYLSGFDIVANYLASGAPNADGRNTVISLTSGTNMDDNLAYTVSNNTSGAKFSQDLGHLTAATLNATNSGLFKASYNDSLGRLRILPATRFPFLWNSGTNIPDYITETGVRTPVPDNTYFVYFIYALQDDKSGEALRIRSAHTTFATLAQAQAYYWETLVGYSPTLGDKEIRPLWRGIFYTDYSGGGAYPAGCKYSVLREITDIRKQRISTVSASSTSVLSTSVVLATVPSGSTSSNQDQFNQEIWGRWNVNQVNPTVNTGVLTFDFASKYECFATLSGGGAIVVGANITVAYSNATNFKTLWAAIQVTGATRTITFPANHKSGDTRWNSLVLTLPVGYYQISVINNGAYYHVVCSQGEV